MLAYKFSMVWDNLKCDKKCQCYKTIGLWLACVCRVKDARRSLLSATEAQESYEAVAECEFCFLSAQQLSACINKWTWAC